MPSKTDTSILDRLAAIERQTQQTLELVAKLVGHNQPAVHGLPPETSRMVSLIRTNREAAGQEFRRRFREAGKKKHQDELA